MQLFNLHKACGKLDAMLMKFVEVKVCLLKKPPAIERLKKHQNLTKFQAYCGANITKKDNKWKH